MSAGGLTLPRGRAPERLDDGAAGGSVRGVLVLAPHPDDFDEVAVALRRFHRSGARIRLAVLSSSANGVEDAFLENPSEDAKAAAREEEQRRSLALFGLDPGGASFERLPTGEGGFLADDGSGAERVAALLAGDDYDLVVLPHGRDTHPDHRRVYAWWRKAARERRVRPEAWLFRDPKTIAMRLDVVAPFGAEEAAWKSDLLRCHASQQARNLRLRGCGLDERILRVNRDTARAAGLREPYAEGFEVEAGRGSPVIMTSRREAGTSKPG